MSVKFKAVLFISSTVLLSSTVFAAPKMDANGNDEITEDEYVAFQMATYNDKDKDFDGRVTRKEAQNWQIERQREQLKDAFNLIDPNKDGRLTEDEYIDSTSKDMKEQISYAQRDIDESFDKMDDDKNGYISRLEYSAFLNGEYENATDMMRDGARQQFKMLDKNSDGIVTDEEYTGMFDAFLNFDISGTNNVAATTQRRERVILDANGDGDITRTEQREYSGHEFNGLDSNKDGVVTKEEKPFLFSSAQTGGTNILLRTRDKY